MKFVYILALVLLVSTCVFARKANNFDNMFNNIKAPSGSSQAKGDTQVEKAGCIETAMDLLMFLYTELQSILNKEVVPDQMYFMLKGFMAMTKFNAAKEACFPQ